MFRYTCQLEYGVVPPARPIRMARVLAVPSVFAVDESSKLMNRPPAVLFTAPLPSDPTITAESVVPVRIGMLNVWPRSSASMNARGLPLLPIV